MTALKNNKNSLIKVHEILNKPEVKKEEKYRLTEIERPDDRKLVWSEKSLSSFNTKERKTFSKILAFINYVKHRRFSDGLTVMYIACTDDVLKSICGTSRSASRLISVMKKYGLICDYNTKFHFGGKNNKAKTYVYNAEKEKEIKKFCTENNINVCNIKDVKELKHKSIKDIDVAFDPKSVKVSSNCHYCKSKGMGIDTFEELLKIYLIKNYKQYLVYKNIGDDCNFLYGEENKELHNKFDFNFTWNHDKTAVTKIGLRSTNSICNSKKEVEEGDSENIVYRDDLKKKYGLEYEYDVSGSIPHVIYLLNFGKWMPSDYDFYKYIIAEYERLLISENINDYEWFNSSFETKRKITKSLFMRVAFDGKTKISGHIKRQISLRTETYNAEEWDFVDDYMKLFYKAIEHILGSLKHGSEVFFHESCIYMEVEREILKSGYSLMRVYDGFYTDKEVEGIKNIIKNIAERYYNKYVSKNKIKKVYKDIKEYVKKEINIKKEYIESLVDTLMTTDMKNIVEKKIKKKKDEISVKCLEKVIKYKQKLENYKINKDNTMRKFYSWKID